MYTHSQIVCMMFMAVSAVPENLAYIFLAFLNTWNLWGLLLRPV